jgi:hypothetical protein
MERKKMMFDSDYSDLHEAMEGKKAVGIKH